MQRRLKNWIESYLDYTENTNPRESFRTWVAISAIASVLQRKVYLEWGSECWYPNFYIILTGPPAAGKGTAMKPARKLLDMKGIHIAASKSSNEKLIGSLYTASTTRLDAGGSIPRFHSALTINAPELTVFLRAGDTDMLSILCDWFDCGDKWSYDTYKHQTQEIANVWVNLLGATTPRLLQTSLPANAFGTGFISRTLFIYEEDKERFFVYPTLDKTLEEDLLIDLDSIGLLNGRFKLAPKKPPDIFEEYAVWLSKIDTDPPIKDPRLLECNQRQPAYLWKLCMVHSAARGDSMEITMEDFEWAVSMLRAVSYKMPMAFAGIGANPLAAVQSQIMSHLMTKKSVHTRELLRMFYQDISQDQLSTILATLHAMKFCIYDIPNRIVHYTPPTEE